MSDKVQRWDWDEDGMKPDSDGEYILYHDAAVNRVCRYIWKSVGDPEFFMWVSEDCGRMELSRPDEGKHCRDCGGKVEVVDE